MSKMPIRVADQASAVRTVNRICDVLNCFTREEPVHNLTALSAELGLPKSTLHRLLAALEAQGMVSRDPSGRGYRLGHQLLHWGLLAQDVHDLRNEALPELHELASATGETAILSVCLPRSARDHAGCEGMCLEKVESSQPVRLAMRAGQRLPLHAGASAKVLLAFLPDTEIGRILDEIDLPRLQPGTLIDRGQLCADLAAARARGFTVSFEETDRGAMGIAAPVYDYSGQLVAGIGIAAPLSRVPPEDVPAMAAHVVAAGERLTARLGGRREVKRGFV